MWLPFKYCAMFSTEPWLLEKHKLIWNPIWTVFFRMFAPVMSSSSRVEEPQRQQNSFSYFDKRGVFFLKDIFVRSYCWVQKSSLLKIGVNKKKSEKNTSTYGKGGRFLFLYIWNFNLVNPQDSLKFNKVSGGKKPKWNHVLFHTLTFFSPLVK